MNMTGGWFGGSTEPIDVLIQVCCSDSVQAISTGEVTPNSFAQQERFKNRKVHSMRPSKGEALALVFCFPAGTQALLVFLWLLSSSRIWHVVLSWKDALTEHRTALEGTLVLWEEEEWEGETSRGKALVSSPLCLLCGTCMHKDSKT